MKNKMSIFVDLYGCPYSLMDKIKDSGSFDCGSIPHGGTKVWTDNICPDFLYIGYKYSDDAEDCVYFRIWKGE